jgi:integrase
MNRGGHDVEGTATHGVAEARLGDDGVEYNLLFTEADGSPLYPADVDEFARLIKPAGLPSITLHGLRHGAATLASGLGRSRGRRCTRRALSGSPRARRRPQWTVQKRTK